MSNAEIPSKSRRCGSTNAGPHFAYVQRPRSELNTSNNFHDVIRLTLGCKAGCKKRTRVISVPSCEVSPERTNPEASPSHFTKKIDN